MPHDRTGRRRRVPAVAVGLSAFGWGLAEATLFFIVPDVLLTWLALRRPRTAWKACAWTLAGALTGGAVMYAWGVSNATGARHVLARIPDVTEELIADVQRQVDAWGEIAPIFGPLRRAPYKIYGVEAGARRLWLPLFLAISVPARLARFALLTGLAALLAHQILPKTPLRTRRMLHVAAWTAFYAWFFWSLRSA